MEIPKKMMAVVKTGVGKMEHKEMDVPTPKGNEVLVKMETSGICHTDLHAMLGDWPVDTKDNLVLGHEGVGIIVAMGDNVTNRKLGDRVGIAWLHDTCLNCEFCLTGRETICPHQNMTSYTKDGTFAEYQVGDADFVAPIPEGLDVIKAGPLMCAGVTTYKAVKQAEVGPNSWLAVVGVGGLGHLAVEYAAAMGINVIGIDINDAQLELAKKAGATHVINSKGKTSAQLLAEVSAISKYGVDGAVITAVAASAFEQGVAIIKPGGTCVLVGLPANSKMEIDIFWTVLQGKKILGSIVGTRQDLKEALEYGAMGKVNPKTNVVKLKDVAAVFKKMEDGTQVGRAVIDFR